MDTALLTRLLKEGTDLDNKRWDWLKLSCLNTDLLFRIADEKAKESLTATANYICALRGSGLALGALLSNLTNKPLLWFRERASDFLFPKYYGLKDRSVLMVDSVAVTGMTLELHGTILREMGARLLPPIVLIDCDLESFRDIHCAQFIENYCHGINSIARLSNIVGKKTPLPIAKDRQLKAIIKMMGKLEFWTGNTICIKKAP